MTEDNGFLLCLCIGICFSSPTYFIYHQSSPLTDSHSALNTIQLQPICHGFVTIKLTTFHLQPLFCWMIRVREDATKSSQCLIFNFIDKSFGLLCYCIYMTMEHTLMFDAIFSSECNEPLFSCKNQLLKTIISINVWLVWTITLNCHLFSWHIFEQHKWLLNFLHSQFLWGCLFRLPSK